MKIFIGVVIIVVMVGLASPLISRVFSSKPSCCDSGCVCDKKTPGFTITKPGLYKDRQGGMVVIACNKDSDIFPWLGVHIYKYGHGGSLHHNEGCWMNDGSWSEKSDSNYDIIGFWTEEDKL
jgi:hypothetical protein